MPSSVGVEMSHLPVGDIVSVSRVAIFENSDFTHKYQMKPNLVSEVRTRYLA